MHNYVLFNTFVHFIIQKLKNKHTSLKTEKTKLAQLSFLSFEESVFIFQYLNNEMHKYVKKHNCAIHHSKINTHSSKSIETEKAKSSHFDRTRGYKNQKFPT